MKKYAAILAISVASLLVLSTARAEMTDHGSHSRHSEKNASEEGAMGHHKSAERGAMFGTYFAILDALKQNSMEGVQDNAKALAQAADKANEKLSSGSEHDCGASTQLGDVKAAASSLSEKADIKSSREQFGKLSEYMVEYQKMCGDADSEKLHIFICDMAKKTWLQEDTEIGNPYYGPSMAKCRREIN
jgi:Cu(I)/Ag(I) efflux system membrane fusion protein